ncbi:hypothetical protein D3C85_581530 [compost metagenome]
MALQLEHVFAGEGVRTREIQGDALVQGLSGPIQEGPVVSEARLRHPTADGLGYSRGKRPGYADYAHSATTLGGGDGGDGFTDRIHLWIP